MTIAEAKQAVYDAFNAHNVANEALAVATLELASHEELKSLQRIEAKAKDALHRAKLDLVSILVVDLK
jgi:hypothetical protein